MARNPRAPKPEFVNPHKLPPQLRMLVRVMGDAAAFRLVEELGGTPVSVPKRMSPEHRLADVLGPVAFAQLVDAYGGETLELPKYDSVARQARHQRVHELLRHHTINQVAVMAGYTKRHVINIKQAAGPEVSAQGDLFEALDQADAEQAEPGDRPAMHDPFRLVRV